MISSWAFTFDYTKIAQEVEVHDEDGWTSLSVLWFIHYMPHLELYLLFFFFGI